jgi:hypothetical protein|tara:strand:+ start:133 stop:249 length:117 start_codon:yes stop_codon:yes gene_type:complete
VERFISFKDGRTFDLKKIPQSKKNRFITMKADKTDEDF